MSISDRIICMSFAKVQQEGQPIELYQRPKNEFVARFLGMPEMLIIDCPIQDNYLIFNNKKILKLPGHYQKPNIRIGLRADDYVESEKGYLNGVIKSIEYLGKDVVAELELENNLGTANVLLKQKLDYHIGEQIKVKIKVSNINLFHPETQERINHVFVKV